MRHKADKIPEEWVWCPGCGTQYGFVNCRVTLKSPRRERCLKCAITEENAPKESTQQQGQSLNTPTTLPLLS